MKYLMFIIAGVAVVACSKPDSPAVSTPPTPPPPVLSSEKAISSASFKRADNPGLASDIDGVLVGDSVKFDLPRGTLLNNLVPTIIHTGKSILPAGKNIMDFTYPVVFTITAEDGSKKLFTFSASKQLSDMEKSILGKWYLVTDSLWDSDRFFYSDGHGSHHPTPGIYYGNGSEYWEFAANNRLVVRQNNFTFNKFYQLDSNNKLDIEELTPYFEAATIDTMDNNRLSFYWNKVNPNAERYYRRVRLKRP
jgi:hypothetical protein